MFTSYRPFSHVCIAIALLGASPFSSSVFSAVDCSTLEQTSIFQSGNPPQVYDEFASSVAASESLMVVVARGDGRSPAGALHVFVREGASWGGHQRLQLSGTPVPDFFQDPVV